MYYVVGVLALGLVRSSETFKCINSVFVPHSCMHATLISFLFTSTLSKRASLISSALVPHSRKYK